MFEQTFKNLDDILRKEAGCASELDYTEQTSWLLFLKYLDDLETARATDAELRGQTYTPIIDAAHRWGLWAAPKDAAGKLDQNRARTGPDLISYVNRELFPYLEGFKDRATSADTIEYKIGEIFGEIRNKFQSGYSLRDAIDAIDQLSFGRQTEKHELSELYEAKIKNMGNAGRNGGEYYTPRPLIRAMIKVIKPGLSDTIYDGAAGSCGFLCEAYDYLLPLAKTTTERERLQKHTFFAKEKKSLAYVIGTMNMILHGIEAPNIVHANTLAEQVLDIQEKDRFDVILANPPFGGKERPEIQQNFPIKTGETAYLFLQHFIKSLRAGGSAAVVIKNTFLSNTDNASVALRRELLESCNLHTVLEMPLGTFQGTPSNTVVLFFEKGESTESIWYYQLDPKRSLGKSNPLTDMDFEHFLQTFKDKSFTASSWSVAAGNAGPDVNLSVQNPSKPKSLLTSPEMKLAGAKELEELTLDALERISSAAALLRMETTQQHRASWKRVKLESVCSIVSKLVDPKLPSYENLNHVGAANMISGRDGTYDVMSAKAEKLTSGKFLFGETAVLYSKIRPYLRKVCRPAFEGLCSADVYPLVPFVGEISRDMLFHILLSGDFTRYAVSGSARAGMPKVNRPHLFAYEFYLPDLEQQKPICFALNEMMNATLTLDQIARKRSAIMADIESEVPGIAFEFDDLRDNETIAA